jgi:hypothetical protein
MKLRKLTICKSFRSSIEISIWVIGCLFLFVFLNVFSKVFFPYPSQTIQVRVLLSLHFRICIGTMDVVISFYCYSTYISPFKSPQLTARRNPCIILFLPNKQLLLRNRRAVSLFWFIPSHGQVFLLGLEYLLQAFRLKIVYTLWTLPYLNFQT